MTLAEFFVLSNVRAERCSVSLANSAFAELLTSASEAIVAVMMVPKIVFDSWPSQLKYADDSSLFDELFSLPYSRFDPNTH